MKLEDEIAAGVFVDCQCLFCGAHLPVTVEDTVICCDRKREWLEQQRAQAKKELH